MNVETEQPRFSVVFESRSLAAVRERSLVLQSMQIAHHVLEVDQYYVVAVGASEAHAARKQLHLYDRENKGWPPQLSQLPTVSNGLLGIAVYTLILIAVHFASNTNVFGMDWYTAGRVDGRLMLSGEWWRSVTALTLHADVGHLAGNLFFGALFGLFTAQLLGQGLAWSLILGAGAAGNITNVLIQHPSHRAVGASTAVFAALGLLTAYTWMHRRDTRFALAYRTAPLISGLVLLAYLGTGDARTDIVAHLTGYAWGSIAGVAAAYWPKLQSYAEPRQARLALVAMGSIAFAWLMRLF